MKVQIILQRVPMGTHIQVLFHPNQNQTKVNQNQIQIIQIQKIHIIIPIHIHILTPIPIQIQNPPCRVLNQSQNQIIIQVIVIEVIIINQKVYLKFLSLN